MKSTFVKGPIIVGDVTIDNAAIKSSAYLAADSAGKIIKAATPGAANAHIYAVIDETRLSGWLAGGVSVSGTAGNPVMNMAPANAFVNEEVTCPNGPLTGVPFDTPYYVRVLTTTTFSIYSSKAGVQNNIANPTDFTGRITPGSNPTTTWFNFESNPLLTASGIDSVIPRGTPLNDFYADLSVNKSDANYPILLAPALIINPALKEIKTITTQGFSWINTPILTRLTIFCP